MSSRHCKAQGPVWGNVWQRILKRIIHYMSVPANSYMEKHIYNIDLT